MVKRKLMPNSRFLAWITVLCIIITWAYLFLEYARGTLLYKEQLHLFAFTRYYFSQFLVYPGGISSYLGEFFSQFLFLGSTGIWIVIGLCILLFGVYNWLYKVCDATSSSEALALLSISFLPAFCVDPYSQIGAIVALSIATVFTIGVLRFCKRLDPFWLLPICIPLLYVLTASGVYLFMAVMLFYIRTPLKRLVGLSYMIISIALLVKLYYTEIYLSLDQYLLGLPFYRLADMPILAYCVVGLPIIVFALFQSFNRCRVAVNGWVCVVLFFFLGIIAWYDTFKLDQEYLFRMDRYANEKKWNELVRLSKEKTLETTLHTSYYNLAVLKKQSDLSFFEQKQQEGLNNFWTPNQLPLKMMGDLCFESGMTNAARAYWFVANAMSPFGHSAILIQKLAEAELVRGDRLMSDKYLSILETTLFYKSYASQLKKEVYPEELATKIKSFRKEHRFWSMDIVDNFQKRFSENRLNRLGLDFMIYKLLVNKSLEKAVYAIQEWRLSNSNLPKLYQEVILLYAYAAKKADLIEHCGITQNQIQRFYNYIQINQSDRSHEAKKQELENRFGSSYWFYFQYNN